MRYNMLVNSLQMMVLTQTSLRALTQRASLEPQVRVSQFCIQMLLNEHAKLRE